MKQFLAVLFLSVTLFACNDGEERLPDPTNPLDSLPQRQAVDTLKKLPKGSTTEP